MHVDGSHRGINSLNLSLVMGSDEERAALVAVKSLDISHNALTELCDFLPMKSLLVIDASHNAITNVADMPPQLAKLLLGYNRIASFAHIAPIECLVELDLTHNGISSLEGCPASLVSLRLGGNKLKSLAGIEELQSLELLDVSNNSITDANEFRRMTRLVGLKTLAVAGNPAHTQHTALLHQLLSTTCTSLLRLDGVAFMASAQRHTQQQEQPQPHPEPTKLEASHVGVAEDDAAAPLDPRAFETMIAAKAGGHGAQVQLRRSKSETRNSAAMSATVASRTTYGADLSASTVASRPAGGGDSQFVAPGQRARGGGDSYASALDSQRERNRQAVAEQRRNQAVDEQTRGVEANIRHLQLLLEEERKMSAALRRNVKQLERDLADSKRVVSDELGQLVTLRITNAKLTDEVKELRQKLDKSARDLKSSRSRQESCEAAAMLRVEQHFSRFDAETRDLRTQLDAAHRLCSRANKARDVAIADAQKLRSRIVELEDQLVDMAGAAGGTNRSLGHVTAIAKEDGSHVTNHISLSSDDSAASSPNGRGGDDDDTETETPKRSGTDAASRLAAELRQWVAAEMEKHELNGTASGNVSHAASPDGPRGDHEIPPPRGATSRAMPSPPQLTVAIAAVPLSVVEGVRGASPGLGPQPVKQPGRSMPGAAPRGNGQQGAVPKQPLVSANKWQAAEEILAATKLNDLRQARHP